MYSFRTTGYNGYAVQYSPYFDSKLACAASANFGLVGNGRLYVLGLTATGIVAEKSFDTQDGLFDCAWAENHENQIVVATGDGSVKLFDIELDNYPIRSWREHTREVFSSNWNLVEKSTFCTSSWDGLVKIWSPVRTSSLITLRPYDAPLSCTYAALFSPHNAAVLASCSSDSCVRVWDPRTGDKPTMSVLAHGGAEILSLDWNKYRPDIIATSSVDRTIKIWDLRMLSRTAGRSATVPGGGAPVNGSPLNEFLGHEYAIRKISWSPHAQELLLSASYDMTARVWEDMTARQGTMGFSGRITNGLRAVWDKHTEFVVDCDWSLWGTPGWVCTVGWDEIVWVWDVRSL
ncbi:WD40-repeat-containing domain protein [Lipomyces oligophaga]|uniref:WD40-repeat-containing domain protein n=1 Tax=Lipomyces oligophaga TaxID=45792 RepID=UPI0034CE0F3F